MHHVLRTRWAAIGAAVAVTLGAGGLYTATAAIGTGDKPVYIALDTPCRVTDTRPAPFNVGPRNSPIGPAESLTIQITGDNGNCTGTLAVPTDAVAVALNVTAIDNTAQSHFRIYPADATLPTVSNLNFGIGQTPIANKVDVGLSPTGQIKIFNRAGTTHAAVDISGYYTDHHHDDRYYTKTQTDTRIGNVPAPTAYGFVDADGTLVGGVGVVESVFDDGFDLYLITLEQPYNYRDFVTVVTPVCGFVTPGTSLDDGLPDEDLLVVGLYDTGSVARTCDFSFVVYPLA